MANQFSVMPAGDMSQGLQGLGMALQYATQQKEEREAKEMERAKQAEAQTALLDAWRSGDPSKMMEAAINHPQISQQAMQGLGLQQEHQKTEAAAFATEVLANPDRAGEIAERRIQLLQMQGRDPKDTMRFYETFQKDPENAIRGLEMNFAAINPESYKAYRDTMAQEAEAVKGIEVDGSVVNPITGEVIYQGQQKAQDQFEVLSPEQAAQMGLPPTGSFKRNVTTGEVSAIGGAQTVVNLGQPSEGERTAGSLARRLDFAQSQINDVLSSNPDAQAPGVLPTILSTAGLETAARISNPADRQIIEAAQDDMLDAALTISTGAAYTKQQFDSYKRSLFPQIGDDQKTLEAKATRLKNFIEAAYTKAGRAAPDTMRSAQGTPVAVTSQAEFDALPPGSIYLEDGVQYRKP